ncbi:MAG: carbohydrate ABC transporter permease [Planctomycetes bacterium]|jgi:multiple sugar transport system permease protein|nr:carbohydrate ABC transporter permease [Planctomycetota bacterium]
MQLLNHRISGQRDAADNSSITVRTLDRSSTRRRPILAWLGHHVVLILASLMALIPFLWMLDTSFKNEVSATRYPPALIPIPFRWQNYIHLFTQRQYHMLLWARNSLTIAVLVVLGTTISSALVAYGFAKIRFRGRGLLFGLMLSTMMIPFPVTMVSMFIIFKWLGDHTGIAWLGTFRPLWVPYWFGSAFSIFMLRQFFMTIPDELSEAARMDGCSELGIFVRIILPLSQPAISAVALFAFLGVWNDFLGPLVYLQHSHQFTLALGLEAFESQLGGSQWNLLMAASVLIILPVVILFFVAQRSFLRGITTTGIKG